MRVCFIFPQLTSSPPHPSFAQQFLLLLIFLFSMLFFVAAAAQVGKLPAIYSSFISRFVSNFNRKVPSFYPTTKRTHTHSRKNFCSTNSSSRAKKEAAKSQQSSSSPRSFPPSVRHGLLLLRLLRKNRHAPLFFGHFVLCLCFCLAPPLSGGALAHTRTRSWPAAIGAERHL